MLYLWLVTYWAVFLAEVVADKSLYTVGALTARFPLNQVLCGVSLGLAGKMLIAVLVGQSVAELPFSLVAGLSTTTFLITALLLALKKEGTEAGEARRTSGLPSWMHGALVSFAAVLLTEWGDVGQITAATLSARYRAPVTVLLSATAALITKALFAGLVGVRLREKIPQKVLRYGACVTCVALGILSWVKAF